MNIAGLYSLISRTRQQAASQRLRAAAPDTCPHEAYDAELDAKRLEAEADRLRAHARDNERMIPNIEMLIHDLNQSPHKSAARTLALRDLEQASMRLRRELGDNPESGMRDAVCGK